MKWIWPTASQDSTGHFEAGVGCVVPPRLQSQERLLRVGGDNDLPAHSKQSFPPPQLATPIVRVPSARMLTGSLFVPLVFPPCAVCFVFSLIGGICAAGRHLLSFRSVSSFLSWRSFLGSPRTSVVTSQFKLCFYSFATP